MFENRIGVMKSASRRTFFIFALLLPLAPAVFAIDYATPGALPALPYAIPILIGAYFLRVRQLVALTAWSVLFLSLALAVQGFHWEHESLDVAGLLAIGVLSAALNAELHRRQVVATELDTIIDAAGAALVLFDTEGKIVRMNAAAQRMLAYGREDLSRPIAERAQRAQLQRADGSDMPLEEFPPYRALHGERVDGVVMGLRRSGRTIWTLASAAPFRVSDATVDGAVISMVDITEQRRLEKQREDFVSTAAHELKTPLQVLKGWAEVLRAKAERETRPEDIKPLEAISRQTSRLNLLVDEMLEMSRLNRRRLDLQLDTVELGAFVSSAGMMLAQMSRAHCIRCEVSASPRVRADRNRLEQVLTNLVSNAIRYSPQGGEILITIAEREGQAVVSVADHGIGIPKEKQGRIFEHFYRAHAGTAGDRGGMGIGLFVSRQIVARHGGEMWFESEDGKGSTFHFALPVAPAQPNVVASARVEPVPPARVESIPPGRAEPVSPARAERVEAPGRPVPAAPADE